MGPNNTGEIAEIKFLLQAVERGLKISKPCYDNYQYDFIIDNDKRRSRVQVKATSFVKKEKNSKTYTASTAHGSGSTKKYTSEHIDFFAIYVVPEDKWFIIPIWAVDAYKVNLIVDCKLSKYFIYQDNWDVFSR